MLSDEEKMAIEHLKNYPINWLIENVNESAIKIIINLIEKQSKEIEELKLAFDNCFDECTSLRENFHKQIEISKNNDKKWEDKIKAKIEEYEKALNILLQKNEWIEPSDTIIRNKFIHYIEFGQSLLEKE